MIVKNILSSVISKALLPKAPAHILLPQIEELRLLSFGQLILLYIFGPFDKHLVNGSEDKQFTNFLSRLRERMRVNLSIRIANDNDLYDIAEHTSNCIDLEKD